MTVKALLEQLEMEHKICHENSIIYAQNRDYHYELGNYIAGARYDLRRAQALNEANKIKNIIDEIKKRVP